MVGATGTGNFCQNDYIIVPMASNVGRPVTGPSQNVDRICGGTLAADVTFTPTPIRSNLLVAIIFSCALIFLYFRYSEAVSDLLSYG